MNNLLDEHVLYEDIPKWRDSWWWNDWLYRLSNIFLNIENTLRFAPKLESNKEVALRFKKGSVTNNYIIPQINCGTPPATDQIIHCVLESKNDYVVLDRDWLKIGTKGLHGWEIVDGPINKGIGYAYKIKHKNNLVPNVMRPGDVFYPVVKKSKNKEYSTKVAEIRSRLFHLPTDSGYHLHYNQ